MDDTTQSSIDLTDFLVEQQEQQVPVQVEERLPEQVVPEQVQTEQAPEHSLTIPGDDEVVTSSAPKRPRLSCNWKSTVAPDRPEGITIWRFNETSRVADYKKTPKKSAVYQTDRIADWICEADDPQFVQD